jgi:hypothetical protein
MKPGQQSAVDIVQWLSPPAMAEWWALQSGVSQPVIASRFEGAADSSGTADFVPLTPETVAGADFVLLDAETLATGAEVILGQPAVGDNWPAQLPPEWALTLHVPGYWSLIRIESNAPPQHLVNTTLGDEILLHGFDLPRDSYRAGETIRLMLHWQALGDVPADYVVFAQLIGTNGRLVAQQDAAPFRQTSRWQAGQQITAVVEIPLAANVPPGTYRLIAGLYQPETGQRLPALNSSGQPWPDDAVDLSERIIIAP